MSILQQGRYTGNAALWGSGPAAWHNIREVMAKIIPSKWASNQDLDELKEKKKHEREQTDKVGNEVVGLLVYKDCSSH